MDFKLKPAMRLFWCVMKPGTKLWMRLVMRPVIVDRLPKDLKPSLPSDLKPHHFL